MFQQRLRVDLVNNSSSSNGGSDTGEGGGRSAGGSSTSILSPSGTRRPSTVMIPVPPQTPGPAALASAAPAGSGGSSTSILSPSGNEPRPSSATILVPPQTPAAGMAARPNRSSGVYGFLGGSRNSNSSSSSSRTGSLKHSSGKPLPEGWEVSAGIRSFAPRERALSLFIFISFFHHPANAFPRLLFQRERKGCNTCLGTLFGDPLRIRLCVYPASGNEYAYIL